MGRFWKDGSPGSRAVYVVVAALFAVAIVVTLGRGSLVSAAQTDLVVVYVDQDLPVGDPAHPLWEQVAEAEIPVSGQNVTPPFKTDVSVPSIRVRSLHNGGWIAFRLEWDDGTRDTGGSPNQYRDSVALQFPREGGEPFVCMGFAGAEVNILHWRADFQRDIEEGPLTIADIFPNARANIYPYPTDVSFRTGRAAGNPLAAADKPSPVEDLSATGFGTLETQAHADATGWGAWDGEKWSVVIARPLVTTDIEDAQFTPGDRLPVALAVWDGNRGDVDGKKAVSAWVSVRLEDLPASAAPGPSEPQAEPQLVSGAPALAAPEPADNRLLWTIVAVGLIALAAIGVPASLATYFRWREGQIQ